MLNHPNITRSWPTIRMENGTVSRIYLVETNLVLAPRSPQYDEKAVNDLLDTLGRYLKRAGYDSAEIIPETR